MDWKHGNDWEQHDYAIDNELADLMEDAHQEDVTYQLEGALRSDSLDNVLTVTLDALREIQRQLTMIRLTLPINLDGLSWQGEEFADEIARYDLSVPPLDFLDVERGR